MNENKQLRMNRNKLFHMSIVSDYSAVGHYRIIFPEMCARTTSRKYAFIESANYIGDPKLYATIRTVRIQRPCTKSQCNFIEKFLKPLSDKFGFWIILDVDDCLLYKDIPKYNLARETFNVEVGKIIEKVMNLADYITTTTEYLRDYYVKEFNLDKNKFIIIPNYLPKWWIGNSYSLFRTLKNFDNNLKNKLKIAFICGGNHFDLNNQNEGIDDFTHLIDWVKSSLKTFEFHFVGGTPKQLEQEVADKKIIVDPMVDILNYPMEIYNRGYNLWVCPLQDNVFNRCKSNIKLIEAWAMGIPVVVQKCECYNRYTPDVFETADDLDNHITSLINDRKLLADKILSGRRIIDMGDNNAPNGWWLERNMDKYAKIYGVAQKTMKLNMNNAVIEGD